MSIHAPKNDREQVLALANGVLTVENIRGSNGVPNRKHEVLHTARHEGYDPFFAKLADWRGEQRGGKRKIADRLLNYVAQRKDMMPYPKCEEQGWDVGTGPMESMCGVTTDRIKGRGRRWDIDNAESLMALEALHQSNLWDRYWAKVLSAQN
jgi:hypothetical protein